MNPIRLLQTGCTALLAAGLAACSSSGGPSTGAPQTSDTPGSTAGRTLNLVYVTGDMPYFGLSSNGALTGVDGDLLIQVEKQLGLKFKPQPAQFAAFLAGIQDGRYNIGVGGVAWTKERAATGLFTDPVYYSPVVVMCKHGIDPSTPDALKGLSVGAISSTIQDAGILAISGVDAHTYPSPDLALQDLISGRLDCVSLDTLTVAYIHRQRPDLKNYDITAIQAPSDSEVKANPGLANFKPYMVAWYLSKNEGDLISTLNTVIDGWYKSGFLAKTLAKWGVPDPTSMLTPIPSFSTDRRGVDRPSTWNAPSVGA